MPERGQYFLPLLGAPLGFVSAENEGEKKRRTRKPCPASPIQLPPLHVGVDEAGRGCLAGPVVAAAVLFPKHFDFSNILPGIADSKKLNEKKRLLLKPLIEENATAFGIGMSWQDEIDAINILNATFRAMARALLALAARLEQSSTASVLPKVFIDGNKIIPASQWQVCLMPGLALSRKGQNQLSLPLRATNHAVPLQSLQPDSEVVWETQLSLPSRFLPKKFHQLPEQEAIVSGDALVSSISAASILAKTARDALMPRLDEFCPGYDFTRHKGYGTRLHCERIAKLGPSILHRKSFKYPEPK